MKILSEFVSSFSEVLREHDGYVVPCPAHVDADPSLRIAVDGEALLLHCRAGCSKSAVLAALEWRASDLFGWDSSGEVEVAAGGDASPTVEHFVALGLYVDEAVKGLEGSAVAVEYLADRFGMSVADAAELRLGVDDGLEWDATAGKYRDSVRLTVPFLGFDGVPRGLQGRALGESAVRWCGVRNPVGASWATLAVMDPDTGLDYVLVTEGPSDALTAYAAGFSAVAVRGASLGRNEALKRTLVAGLREKRVIVCGDNDRAGADFSATLAGALSDNGVDVSVMVLPDGVGDLNEWYTSDRERFSDHLSAAVRNAERFAPLPLGVAVVAEDGDAAPLFHHTDLGNARRLRHHLGGLVRHVPEIGFMLWTGKVWEFDYSDRVRTAAHEVVDEILEDGFTLEEEGAAEAGAAITWGKRSQSTRALDSMVRECRALPGVAMTVDQLDSNYDLLAVSNGVVNLKTGVLGAHDPALFLSKLVDVEYRPEAVAPRWVSFLEEIFPGLPEMPLYIQRLIGYGITGHTSEQCFAVMYGRGANGKSVLTDTLSRIFAAVTTTTPFATFEARPGGGGIPNDVAALMGSRLVVASEGDAGAPMAESVVKRLTGQDLVTARFMRKEFFSFRPTFLIMLATNHKPRFRGADEGLWRRVKLIPFRKYFAEDERDHYLADKLYAEAEGILAWAVAGAVSWYEHGLQDPDFVTTATEEYRGTSDALGGFFPGMVQNVEGCKVSALEMYRGYLDWCDEQLTPDKLRWSKAALNGALEERGLMRKRSKSGQVWMDVVIGDVPEEDGAEPEVKPVESGTLSVNDVPTGLALEDL